MPPHTLVQHPFDTYNPDAWSDSIKLVAGSQVIFKVRRPFYFINSSIFVEDGEGNTIGEVQQRWHLWQRNYDLYIDRKQYASINSGLWAWEFLLKDKDGGTGFCLSC